MPYDCRADNGLWSVQGYRYVAYKYQTINVLQINFDG